VPERDVKAPAPKVFYFGCLDSGHHMYEPGESLYLMKPPKTPWGQYPDGTLCPEKTYENGLALLHHKDDWTALAFWDQSGDTRPGSHSTFLVHGTYTFDEMLALAKAQWAGVFARMRFQITEMR
jgi:hypothetical protein